MNGKCVPTQKEEFNVFFFLSSLFLHVYYIQVHIPLGSVGGRWMIGVMPMCAAKRGESNFRALSGCLCVYNTYIGTLRAREAPEIPTRPGHNARLKVASYTIFPVCCVYICACQC